jgi:hypothetical protein
MEGRERLADRTREFVYEKERVRKRGGERDWKIG